MIDPRYIQMADGENGAGNRYGLPKGLVSAVMVTESDGNPHLVSKAGAMGLMQLMPATVITLRVKDPFNPAENIEAGAHYLADMVRRYPISWEHILAAYNGGPEYVARHPDPTAWAPDIKEYVRKVFSHWRPGSIPSFDKAPQAPAVALQPQRWDVVVGPAEIMPVNPDAQPSDSPQTLPPQRPINTGLVIAATVAVTLGLVALIASARKLA
jgi:hypothetical protein